MIYKFSSIKEVINKVYRDSGSPREFPFEDCIEWCGEALDLIGATYQYVDKITGDLENPHLIIENYKAELPCDFKSLSGISINGLAAFYSGNTFYKIGDGLCASNPPLMPKPSQTTYKTGDGSTVTVDNTLELPYAYSTKKYEFTINDNYIFTNVKEGTICLAYNAIPTDSDGYPLVPDNVYYRQALTSYLFKMLDYIRWRKNPSKDNEAIYRDSDKQWMFYCGSAGAQGIMPDGAAMEKIKNDFVSLIPKVRKYNVNFR